MNKHDYIEKEVREYVKRAEKSGVYVDAHNLGTLRTMLGRDWDFLERNVDRVDSNNSHDDQ